MPLIMQYDQPAGISVLRQEKNIVWNVITIIPDIVRN